MGLEFGLGFGQEQTVHNIAERAKIADDLGYSHITQIDMGNLSHEVNVMMTLAAQATRHIKIGHGVTNPRTYHPGAISNAMASIREMSDDRAFVGIGAGGPYGQFLARGASIKELKEAVQFIKAYTAGEEASFGEESWHSEWIRSSRWNGQSVPVYVAVAGPKTCQLAGEVADAVFTIGMDPELQKWRMEQIQKGAERAGRDPSEIDIWVRTQCYVADSKEEAKRYTEPYAATCVWELYQILRRDNPDVLDLRRRIERRHPGLIDEFKQIYDAWDPYYTERIGGPQTVPVTQRVVDFFLATGTIEDVDEQIHQVQELGVKGISSVMFSITDDIGMMQRIAREIVPKFN